MRLDVAIALIRLGWSPVPIPAREKGPRLKGWQNLRLTEADAPKYFNGAGNIGIILGKASGGLVDIDLDCAEAVKHAVELLPTTHAIFGRERKPLSHWLYRVLGAARPIQFKDPITNEMLLELRGDGGMQTVFPPSVHPSGEVIEWEREGEPATIEYSALVRAAKFLGIRCLAERYLPEATDGAGLLKALGVCDARIAHQIREWLGLSQSPTAQPTEFPASIISERHATPILSGLSLPDHLKGRQCRQIAQKILHQYARGDLDDCVYELTQQKVPGRANLLFRKAIRMGIVIARGEIGKTEVANALYESCVSNGLVGKNGEHDVRRQIERGFKTGATKAQDNFVASVNRTNGQTEEARADRRDHQPATEATFPLRWHGEYDPNSSRKWLVKQLLPETGAGLISGQWGTGKTFVALDLAIAVTTGGQFAGRTVKRMGGVLFIPAEGASEIPIRLHGLVETKFPRHEAKLPFAWAEYCPTLTGTDAIKSLAMIAEQAAERMQEEFDMPLVLVIIDTMSAAAGFKDENSSSEGQQAMNVLNDLSRRSGALVIACDHFGKVADTGTRGTSAKEASADVVLACLGDKTQAGNVTNLRIAVRKLRGGATGAETAFTLRTIDMGLDQDGEPITTCVVDWSPVTVAAATKTAKGDGWTKRMEVFRVSLMATLKLYGRQQKPFDERPTVCAVELEKIREEFDRRYPVEGGGVDREKQLNKRRQAFKRSREEAESRGLIEGRDVNGTFMIWLASPDGQEIRSHQTF